jgi:hypothetical protein
VFVADPDGQVEFAEAAALRPADLAAVQQQVRRRVLRWFARAGHLDAADARDMAGWDHGGGFSLDASVRIEGADRSGLERLLRYCARPPLALERLEQTSDEQLVYRLEFNCLSFSRGAATSPPALPPAAHSGPFRRQDRDDRSALASVDAEIGVQRENHRMRHQLGKAYQAGVRQGHGDVCVLSHQRGDGRAFGLEHGRYLQHAALHELRNSRAASPCPMQEENGLGEHGLAGCQRRAQPRELLLRPVMVRVAPVQPRSKWPRVNQYVCGAAHDS